MSRKSKFSQNNLLNASLQFASDVITICAYLQILQNAAAFITKCIGWIYYKMLHPLLHNTHMIITKCRNRYYKMCNVLQNASLLQNAAEQSPLVSGIHLETYFFGHAASLNGTGDCTSFLKFSSPVVA